MGCSYFYEVGFITINDTYTKVENVIIFKIEVLTDWPFPVLFKWCCCMIACYQLTGCLSGSGHPMYGLSFWHGS